MFLFFLKKMQAIHNGLPFFSLFLFLFGIIKLWFYSHRCGHDLPSFELMRISVSSAE
jgi:hypothetical protein